MSSFPPKLASNANYSHNILGFVPSLIIQHLLDKETRKFPEKQSFKTVVMFADISGFTNLSETLQKRGNEGSELLAFVLNRYMELLIKSIGRSGGDIFKFAGDAMIVLWPPPKSIGNQLQADLLTLLRQAVQSGLDIKNKLSGAVMFEGKIRLSVKIGFGIGDVTIMHVGGVFQRAEYLPAGDPLNQAFECEHHATGGGQVIVSHQVWNLVQEYFNGEQIKEAADHHPSKNAPFYLVHNLKSGQSSVQMRADAALIRTKITQGAIHAILPLLESYIPKALLPFIMIDQEKWSAELRRLSVMFLNLGIDLTTAKTEEGLDRIQIIIKTIQSCLYQNEGSLNKLLMDDKGSTLIVVFGLPPLAHQDDSVRGILAAFKLREELNKINCPCSIGLTTGLVFTGVVGTSGNRREYSVLGDTVNLSARLMQAACGEKEHKILVDEETKRDAEHKIKFKFFECRTVKGKTGQIPFYIPINCLEEEVNLSGSTTQLRTHLYNVPDDLFQIEEYKDSLFMLRREKETEFLVKMLIEFMDNEERKVVLVRGEYGIGKTLFVRCVLESLKGQLAAKKSIWKEENLMVFIHGFNNLFQKKKINGWRRFILFGIEKLRSRFGMADYHEVMAMMLVESWRKKLIENALDLDPVEKAKKEIVIEKEKISKEEIMILKDFLFSLLEKLTEKDYPPIVICQDDMQNFDEESWGLLLQVIENFKKKIFILCVVRDTYFETGVNILLFHKYLKRLTKMMKREEYQSEWAQIQLKEIKVVDCLTLIRKVLCSNEIPPNLLYFIHQKTKGNPLKVINLVQNLVKFNLIQKNMDFIVISEELNNHFYINEFITLPIPLSSLKINSPILDHLNCKQILLMKLASIIGDTFSLTVLKKLNPFKDQGLPNEEVENVLQELERNEFIGIIDETETNITYQFNDLFMREVLYQRMTYNQRRELHKLFAESMQNVNTDLSINKANEKMQTEKLIFHWKLAENHSSEEVQKNSIEQSSSNMMTGFSTIAKRSVIVKKISSLASTKYLNPLSTLKKGFLQYKLVRDLMWSKGFFVLSFKELKFYSTEEEFLEKPEKFIGLITLKQIFSFTFMSEKTRTVFLLRTGSFQTRDNRDLGLVHMNLAHDKFDLLEEWATYMEFARAKAIYDDFVNTFGKISFPLQSEQRMIKKEKALRKKIKNKIEGSQTSLSINININMKENKGGTSDSMKDLGQANVTYLQGKQQNLKESLTAFINQSLLLFLSNIIEKAYSEQNKDKMLFLGKNNVYVKKFPQFFKVKPSLLEDEEEELGKGFEKNLGEMINKKKSVSIDLKGFSFQRQKSMKTSSNNNNEENVVEDEEKANMPFESLDSHLLRSRIKSSTRESIKTPPFQEKNKLFTFNSTVSLEQTGMGSFELRKNSVSSQILSNSKISPKLLSQIQEEDFENEQKNWNFQKGVYKLRGNPRRQYLYIGNEPEIKMPSVFYSRRNSLRKTHNRNIKGKIKKLKIQKSQTTVYIESECQKKEKFTVSNKKNEMVSISNRGVSESRASQNLAMFQQSQFESSKKGMLQPANMALQSNQIKSLLIQPSIQISKVWNKEQEDDEIIKIRKNESNIV